MIISYFLKCFNRTKKGTKNFLSFRGERDSFFHDLRHSCASTMLALGKQMKDIQMWLGHSDIGTTGNIYSHLDSHSKVQTGAAIYDALTD